MGALSWITTIFGGVSPTEIRPEQYGAVGDGQTDDSNAIQTAINEASESDKPLIFSRNYGIQKGLVISKEIVTRCVGVAKLTKLAGAGPIDMITIKGAPNGYRVATLEIPSLQGLGMNAETDTGSGLVLDGCSVADIRCHTIQSLQNGLVLKGEYGNCLGNRINIHQINGIGNHPNTSGIQFYINNANQVIQGNEIYVNFLSGLKYPVYFNAPGLNPNWDSNKIVTQAIDSDRVKDAICFYVNAVSTTGRIIFRCENWLGGFNYANYNQKYFVGDFRGMDAYMRMADTINADSWNQWNIGGYGNTWDFAANAISMTKPVHAANFPNNRANFNGGSPIYSNRLFVGFPTNGDWHPDTLQTFYIYHPICDGNSCVFRINAPPHIDTNGGILCFRIWDNHSINKNEIGITLLNATASIIRQGTTVFSMVDVGK